MKKENNITCTQAQPCYFDYLAGQQNSTSEMEFEHIKHCSRCQDEIKRLGQEIGKTYNSFDNTHAILAMHHRYLSTWIDCDVIKPFLASQAHGQLRIEVQTPVTVHIARCQACQHDLQTMLSLELSGPQLVEAAGILSDEPCGCQHLDERTVAVIGGIRNRTSSGIVTRLDVNAQGQTSVQVRHARRAPSVRRHVFIRFTAAAGILLVASLVIMMTTSVGGISIQNVYNAIHTIENCKIEIRDVDDKTPGQILLISRKLNLAVSQRKNETVILDFRNKRILKSTPETGIVTESSDSKLESTINRPDFGLLPFDSIAQIPSKYQWKRLDDLPLNKDLEIYELSWTESGMAVGPIEMTWRGYLLPGSHLPVRIEWREKRIDKPQEVITEIIIQYPDTPSIMKELQSCPLYQLFAGDQIK